MAETDPKAAPSSSASGNASSSSAAAAQAAVREAAQAQADDQRFRRLDALERPNTAPAAQPRAGGESLTNLHNGSRTEVFIDDDATPAAGSVVEKAAAPAAIGGGSGVAPSDLSPSNAVVVLPAGPVPENSPVAGDSSTTFLTLGGMDGTSAAPDGSGGTVSGSGPVGFAAAPGAVERDVVSEAGPTTSEGGTGSGTGSTGTESLAVPTAGGNGTGSTTPEGSSETAGGEGGAGNGSGSTGTDNGSGSTGTDSGTGSTGTGSGSGSTGTGSGSGSTGTGSGTGSTGTDSGTGSTGTGSGSGSTGTDSGTGSTGTGSGSGSTGTDSGTGSTGTGSGTGATGTGSGTGSTGTGSGSGSTGTGSGTGSTGTDNGSGSTGTGSGSGSTGTDNGSGSTGTDSGTGSTGTDSGTGATGTGSGTGSTGTGSGSGSTGTGSGSGSTGTGSGTGSTGTGSGTGSTGTGSGTGSTGTDSGTGSTGTGSGTGSTGTGSGTGSTGTGSGSGSTGTDSGTGSTGTGSGTGSTGTDSGTGSTGTGSGTGSTGTGSGTGSTGTGSGSGSTGTDSGTGSTGTDNGSGSTGTGSGTGSTGTGSGTGSTGTDSGTGATGTGSGTGSTGTGSGTGSTGTDSGTGATGTGSGTGSTGTGSGTGSTGTDSGTGATGTGSGTGSTGTGSGSGSTGTDSGTGSTGTGSGSGSTGTGSGSGSTGTGSGTGSTGTVAAQADAPSLTVAAASGLEDHPIALSIGAGLASPAAGESLSVVISGVPAGALLSAGTDNGDGTWTLTGAQLSGLTLTPPADFSGSLGLTVTATATVNGTQASHSEALTVTVAAQADAPTLSVAAAVGLEDQPIALSIASGLVSPAAGESLSVVISGVPVGALLSAGTDNGDGTWTLTSAQLYGLTLTPPADFSGSLGLTVTATATVNGTQASHSEALTVTVAAQADAPTLSVAAAAGLEDQPIALSIGAGLASPAAGESLSVVIAGVPAGATLSAGTDNGDGTWTLTGAQLAGLTLTPPHDFSGSFGLTVTATASVNGTQASHSEALTVTVAAQADAPTLSVAAAAAGLEDQPIALSIASGLVSPAAGESLSVVIAGVPAGATLSAGTDNGDGTWTLTGAQLSGLTLTPPSDFSGSLGLTVTATATVNGTQASHSEALTVTVAAQADAPTLSVAAAVGLEDQPIALSIASGLVSPAAGESLSVVISGVPVGALLSAGTDNGDGTWTLTGAQLAGLTLTPPSDFSGSLGLTVTATATVNGTQASHSEALTVTVAAQADAPTLSVAAAVGLEGQPIALSIGAGLASPAAGESLSVVISGVPAGALLSAGTDNGDGTWTLTGAQLAGLTLTPPADFSGSLGLTVTATASVNGTQASHSEALTVTVAAQADAPTLSVAAAVGLEDQPIALSIAGGLVAAAPGETLSVTVAGVPAGATLSAGTHNADGTWTLTSAQLSGLTLTPPHDFSGSFGLTVTATASVNGTQASHSEALTVTVAPVADTPTLTVASASGLEDHAIALAIGSALVSPALGETLGIVVAGVPAGAVLSAGVDNGDGTWTLTSAQLAGLTLTPPADFSGSLGLTVTATATVNGTQASHSEALTVTVAAQADAPTLSVAAAAGLEDQPIALSIASGLVSPAAGESLSVVIAGVPAGATLSAGTDNGDGTWTLTGAQLAGLTLTPPADFSGSLGLTVTATASVNGTQASHSEALTVTVAAQADAPTLSVAAAVGLEDQPIALSIASGLVSPAAGESLSVVISGVPVGALLSAGTDNGDGTWTLTGAQLAGLTLTPPSDFSGSLGLTVTATATVNGTQASHSEALTVTVAAQADAPTLSVAAAVGLEGQPIALSIGAGLASPAAGESLSVVISGVPAGALLSAGTDNGDGTWTLTGAQLAGLTLTPPADFSGSLGLTVTATASVNGTQASHSEALTVTVAAQADAPTLSVAAAVGLEDQPIALSIAGGLVAAAPGETLSVTVAGVPAGATLSAGTHNADGTWTLTSAQLSGLTLTPPHDFSGSFGLTVTATASVNGTQASHSEALTVTVAPVADTPTLTVASASGLEDHAIALAIGSALVSPALGETLGIVVAGVPAGAVLSAGVDNGDGTWTLTSAQLAGLTLTPPADFSGSLGLTVTATATVNGTQASHSEALTVTVAAQADAPTLSVAAAAGLEDQPIALSIASGLVSPAAGESLSVVIAGVPAGATLSAGTDNGDGTWTLTGAQLAGLTLTPPADFSGSLGLTVTATASVNGTQASHSEALTVTVAAQADAPTLSVAAAVGLEDQPIALSIASGLVSPAAGESLSVVISGVPVGALLSAGTDNGDGTWTLTGAQLAGLTLTPPSDFSGSLGLTVTATATVNGTQASHSEALTVTVAAQADAPTLSVAAAVGLEGQPIALSIGAGLASPAAGESLSVVISGVPAGALLSAGTDNGDGTWTLTGAQLAGLTLTPPADFSGSLGLTVTATASVNGTQASHSEALTVTVAAQADAPTLSVAAAVGLEDQPIALSIAGGLVAAAPGETLSVTVAGVPAGATLSAGTHNADGTWTLTSAQLSGLTLTPPHDFSGSFGLTVTATASVNGTQASHSEALTVTVAPVADTPTLTVASASGLEDHAIALAIGSALVSPALGETLGIVVAGVPAGAVLSAGVDNGDGTWTLTSAQLAGLTLTPPADFSGSLGLTVTATATVNGTQASHSEALTVTVAAQADAPTLSVAAAVGLEGQPIALSIGAGLASPAAGESLSVVISGVPAGALLSAGTDNGDGTWTLTGAQLAGLTLTPPHDFSGSLGLTVTATASVNGTQASHSEALTVTVAAQADAPTLSVAAAVGLEDQPIALSIAGGLVSPAAGESLSVVIAGVPAGATLSAGTDNGDGTWTLTGAQLSGLTLTPPDDFSGSFGLTVTATASVNGTQASHSEALTVTVAPVADTPTLTVASASGLEDHAIALAIGSALVSPALGETLGIVVAGVPAGAVLSAGVDNGDGTWTLTGAQLAGLTLAPPENYSGSFALTVTATAAVNGTQTSHSETLSVTVAAVADTPSLAVLPAYGREDQVIGLNIASHLADIDGSETLSVTLSGVPTGATLSAGVRNADGSWTLTGAQLSGLTLTPPVNFSGSIALTVTARATEATGGSATTTTSLPVIVTGVADTPTVTVSAASGAVDTAIPLSIGAALQDTDGSETLSVRISGIPAGARLSHGQLTSSAGGFTVWTLAPGDLAGLTITPPCHYTGVMTLGVRAISTESDGDSALGAASTLAVTVTGSGSSVISSGVNLNLGVVAGVEDTPVALNLLGGLTGLLGSVTLDSVVVTGVGNATLSAGVRLADGSYLLTPAQLAGLTLIPPHDVSGDYSLSATVNLGGSQLGTSLSASIGVHVVGVADAPTLSVAAAAGAYATAIPLSITGALTDTSGTESLHYILGVAAGAHLSAGIDNGDGTWTVLPSQLSGLKVTPPYGFSGTLPITVTAVSQEVGGATAFTQKTLAVTVAPAAGAVLAALLSAVPLNGVEDVGLDLGATLLSLNLGSIASVSISGIPAGATLSSGGLLNISANNISVGLLSGLKLNMPANYSGDFQLTTTVKLVGGLITINKDIAVHVAPVADLPVLSVGATVNGTEDQAIGLNISGSLLDLDGSESLSFTVAGLPVGARLSAGHVNPVSGAWTLTASELLGLKLLPPPDFSGSLTLSVGAVASELLGAAGVTLKPLTVTVAPVTDTPILALPSAVGSEDQPIALTIGVAAGDIDGSESITGLVVSGLPTGATLNRGTSLGNGSYSLTTADLVGLTMTPPANYAGTLALTVTATAKDGTAASASASGTLSVTVKPVADAPSLTVADVTVHQGHDASLSIGAALLDADGSEVLSVVVAGLPAGARLSAGLNNGDGSWTLTAAQLAGLKLHTPASFSGDLALTVTAHALDGSIGPCNQSLADRTATLTVHVQPETGAPVLALPDVTVLENASVLLDLGVGVPGLDVAANVSVTVAGLPVGASLSAGTHNQDGSWTLTAAQLAGLRLTPPHDSTDDFTLTVTASAQVAGAAALEATGSLHVNVLPDFGGGLSLNAGFAIAPSLGLSALGTQIVAGATIALGTGFHDGDCLTLGGLHTETDASGHLVIAGTGIQVSGGGYDTANHTLTLSGEASASVYQSVLRSIRLDPSDDAGSRSIAIDLFDHDGHAMPLGHQAITLDVGLGASTATGTVLSGVLGLLDGGHDGVVAAANALGQDVGSLADALLHNSGDGGVSSTLPDDPLHNAANYLHA